MTGLTVLPAAPARRKRVLLTTALRESVVPLFTNRRVRPLDLDQVDDRDDLLQLCMNAEHQMGFEWPYGGIELIKANVPSIDVLEYPTRAEYETRLNEKRYDAVAFTVYRRDVPSVLEMAALARAYGVPELWAGNYGADSPELQGVIDRAFLHEGAEAMKPLVEGEPLTYRRHPVLMGTMLKGLPIGYLYTAVGCRYQCRFCPTRVTLPEPHYTPVGELRRVLDEYVRGGAGAVSIMDETFMQDAKHSEQVIDELCRRGLHWHCTTRINLIEGRVDELFRRGMRSVYVGVESLVDSTLKSYQKGQTLRRILNVFDDLNRVGIRTTVTYIFGFETDTAESILEAIDVIKTKLRPFCLSVLILTPYANSQMPDLESRVIDHNPRHWDSQHLVWEHPTLSPADLRQLLWVAHRETCHPHNLLKRRIVGKLQAMEAPVGPLWSGRIG